MFSCPNCSHNAGYQPVEAPLTGTFPAHCALKRLLAGHEEAVPCANCPAEDPKPAAVHCQQCDSGLALCQGCDESIHALRVTSPLYFTCTVSNMNVARKSPPPRLAGATFPLTCVQLYQSPD